MKSRRTRKEKKRAKLIFVINIYLFCIFSWPATVVHYAWYCWWVAGA